jgi:hypothetical protein
MFKSFLFVVLVLSAAKTNAQVTDHTISTVERAMSDELTRAKSELKLKGLIDPFFISYTVGDQTKLDISAANGSLSRSQETRERRESVRLLVNNYQFNDENFNDNTGFFSFSSAPDNTLPLDDDYNGIRRALWLSTDDLFKDANENFSKKKAAFEHKQLAEELKNLPDFSQTPPVTIAEAPVQVRYDRTALEEMMKRASAVFANYPEIQTSSLTLSISNGYEWIQNTEGTRSRKPVTLAELSIQASTQAVGDGQPVALSKKYVGKLPDELPNSDALKSAVTTLAQNLVALAHAPRFDKEYTGPVLFEDDAAADFIADNVISRLTSHREDLLGNDVSAIFSSGKTASLKEKITTRVLPKTVSIDDRPMSRKDALGYYAFDDEGVVPASDLKLVDKGILKTLYMTRTPTKEIREPNGHARSTAGGLPGLTQNVPAAGIVEFKDDKATAKAMLHKDLLSRAKEDGYDYGIVVRSFQTAMPGEDAGFSLQDMLAGGKMLVPALAYKVYADGHEELVRALEVAPPSVRDLREVITSKETATRNMLISGGSGGLFSFGAKVPATLIGPTAVLEPELEVQKKKGEAYPTLPVVARP